jgi:hypothetical protein
MKIVLQIIMILILGANVAIAGEYGLGIDNSIKSGCRFPKNASLNYCSADRIASDLFRHFRDGKEYEIKASYYGFDRGVLSFRGAEERKIVYGAISSLLALEKPHFENELMDIVRRFPFKSMRAAINRKLKKSNNSKAGVKRLSKAYMIVEQNYRN